MTKEELKQAYIHGNLSKGVVHCDKESVSAGLEKLTELISLAEKADENSNQAINNLQNLNGFYGVVKNNCLAEDNLLYDLDIPSYGGSNTEEIVNAYICSSFTTNERQFACHSNCFERFFSLNAYTQFFKEHFL